MERRDTTTRVMRDKTVRLNTELRRRDIRSLTTTRSSPIRLLYTNQWIGSRAQRIRLDVSEKVVYGPVQKRRPLSNDSQPFNLLCGYK